MSEYVSAPILNVTESGPVSLNLAPLPPEIDAALAWAFSVSRVQVFKAALPNYGIIFVKADNAQQARQRLDTLYAKMKSSGWSGPYGEAEIGIASEEDVANASGAPTIGTADRRSFVGQLAGQLQNRGWSRQEST